MGGSISSEGLGKTKEDLRAQSLRNLWFIVCGPFYLKTQADEPASLPWPAVDTSQRPRDSSTEDQSRFSCVHLDSEQLSRLINILQSPLERSQFLRRLSE